MFKVTINYIIIHSIIYLIKKNGVVQEFNNGVINGDFLLMAFEGSYFINGHYSPPSVFH